MDNRKGFFSERVVTHWHKLPISESAQECGGWNVAQKDMVSRNGGTWLVGMVVMG